MNFICRLKIIFAEEKLINPSFTQSKFAEKIEITRTALSAIVNGKSKPSFEVLYKICLELNRDVRDIWIIKDEEESILDDDISTLDLSPPVYFALKRNHIKTIEDLLEWEDKLLKIRGIGKVKLDELLTKIEEIKRKM